jgi:hypothetical protein
VNAGEVFVQQPVSGDTPAAAPVALTGAIIVGLARSNETFSHAAEFGVGTTLEAGLMLVPANIGHWPTESLPTK